MIVLLTLFFIVFLLEVPKFLVLGGFVSKETTRKYIDLNKDDYRINTCDSSILSMKYNYNYISSIPFGVFSKYYIYKLGRVPRWSKLHRKIDEYFKIALKDEYK